MIPAPTTAPMQPPALNAPMSDPFAPFAPPQNVALTQPLPFEPLPPQFQPPPGPPEPGSPLNTPLGGSPPAAQTPFGGTGQPVAPTAMGGADYMQASPNVLGDSPYRRVKRGAFTPMTGLTQDDTSPWRGAGSQRIIPDGMRAV